jgi:hypothetical protein
MAAELVAKIRSGASIEREAAYAELLRIEAQHNAGRSPDGASSSTPAAAPVRTARDELRGLKLTALRARAMEAELGEAEVERAMDADDPTAALVGLLSAPRPSAQEKAAVEIAVACASPLCEVLCKPIAKVSVDEHRRAALVLAAMSGVDPARVGVECQGKPDQYNIWKALSAPDSALGVALAKEPAALTLEDALTVGCIMTYTVQWSTNNGCDAAYEATGMTSDEWLGLFLPATFMMVPSQSSDERNLVLVSLFLELLKAPEKLPEFAMGELYPPTLSSSPFTQLGCGAESWLIRVVFVQLAFSLRSHRGLPVDPPSLPRLWSWMSLPC